VLTAVAALILLAVPGIPSPPLYVSLAGFAMAAILIASNRISAYLKVFVSVYGIGYLLLAGSKTIATMGLLPPVVAALLPPAFAATGAVVFAAIVLGISYLEPIRAITNIADPYFANRDRPQRMTMNETSCAAWLRSRIDRVVVCTMKLLTSAWMR
jgi:putative ATP-binding cassette transporter